MDDLSRRRLIEAHLSLARGIALQVRQEVSRRLEVEELVAYGRRGLVEAAQRFDPEQGVGFASFAWRRVRGAMFDGLREMGELRRGEYARLLVAERTGELVDPGDELRLVTVGLDSLAGIDEPADQAEAADQRIEREGVRRRIRRLLRELPARERQLVEKFYFEDMSLCDAGRELGLSRSWASRLHARAVHLLRERLAGGPES